jgi:hypothetical protein
VSWSFRLLDVGTSSAVRTSIFQIIKLNKNGKWFRRKKPKRTLFVLIKVINSNLDKPKVASPGELDHQRSFYDRPDVNRYFGREASGIIWPKYQIKKKRKWFTSSDHGFLFLPLMNMNRPTRMMTTSMPIPANRAPLSEPAGVPPPLSGAALCEEDAAPEPTEFTATT